MRPVIGRLMHAALTPLMILGCANVLQAQTAPHDLWTPELLRAVSASPGCPMPPLLPA